MINNHGLKLLIILFFVISNTWAQIEWNYISPVPGSKYINPENNIAFRHGDVLNVSSVSKSQIIVKGSLKGEYTGGFLLSNDKRTLIFYPDQPFQFGEIVHVSLDGFIKTENEVLLKETTFNFKIKPKYKQDLLKKYYETEHEIEIKELSKSMNLSSSNTVINSTDVFAEGLAHATITEFDNPAPGYVFCSPRQWEDAPYEPYMVILDNYGTPVFYRQWPRRADDFKLITGNRMVFCDFDRYNPVINKYIVMDSKFNFIDTLLMGNGYYVDQHDMLMRENGNHFLLAYDPQLVNMDTVYPGGDTAATVIGFIIQELDASHNVIFQWRSWDHYQITDANHTDFTANLIDYVHGNAFEIDHDGNLMICCRHMEEVTKIDMNTCNIIWRMGLHAQNNMFNFINDTIGFSWQHDIRRLDNGNITLYDNGNYHDPQFSQALEYVVDEENHTIEKVWNYIHDPVVYAMATGCHRRLPNNNSFICWGITWPIAHTEAAPDGSVAWNLLWPDRVWEYRAFKFNWKSDFFEPGTDTLNFGTFSGNSPVSKTFTITNNSNQEVLISSTNNHWDSYYVTTQLPLGIGAGGQENITVSFYPNMQGQINDVLTLNYDSFFTGNLHQRISCQVVLTGYVDDNSPPTVNFDPYNGSTNIILNTIVKVIFNEPVIKTDGSTLKGDDLANIFIFKEDNEDGADVEYTGWVNAWKTEITVTPNTLKPDQKYYLEIKGNTIKDNEGNIVTESQTSVFTTGDEFVIEENILNYVSVFPNPTDDKVILKFKKTIPEFIRVLDLSGRIVTKIERPADNPVQIDLENQSAGIYFVEMGFEGREKAVSLKIIKQ